MMENSYIINFILTNIKGNVETNDTHYSKCTIMHNIILIIMIFNKRFTHVLW